MFGKTSSICVSCKFLLILFVNLCALGLAQNYTTPPLEFPNDKSEYTFRHNKTSLETLIAHTSNTTTNDTEVYEVEDLRHGGRFANISHHINQSTEVPEIPAESELKNDRKFDTELIEDGSKTEETRTNNSSSVKSVRIRDSYGAKTPVVQGQLAGILAGVLVVIAVLGYAALLSWRRFLESRYGNREMLVNEEDFYDPNDMRHFSL